jgi:hypothetical protein
MQFRTELKPIPSPGSIHFKDKILLCGSCFSDHIGKKLSDYKFKASYNPLGIAYNPYALSRLISHYGIDGASIQPEELWRSQGMICHRDFHSCNNQADPVLFIEHIEKKLDEFCDTLLTADWLFLTLGTSWIYTHQESGDVVSNCHKLSASAFQKSILEVDDIVNELNNTFHRLLLINPDIHIVLTVSPVRHLKDGMIENSRSKARLIEAAHSIEQASKRISYFPSYELLMDDLRDYRFYKEDMVHPSSQAIDYVWEYFKKHFFDKSTIALLPKIKKLVDARNHRILHPESDAITHFRKKNLALIAQLRKQAPFLDVSEELIYFTALMHDPGGQTPGEL